MHCRIVLIPGAYFITIRYRPEDNAEVPIILRPRNEETMMKWYNTLVDLHKQYVEAQGDYNHRTTYLLDQQSLQARNASTSNMRSLYPSRFDGRIDVPSPITPPGSGSEDGNEGTPMSRTASGSGHHEGLPNHQIPRK